MPVARAKASRIAGTVIGLRTRGLVTFALMAGACLAHAADEFVYTVQAGDHPWNIAHRYLKGSTYYLQLSRLNRIVNDRRLLPGTQLHIPSEWLKLQALQVHLLAVRGDTVVVSAAGSHAATEREVLLAGSSLRTGAQASATLEFQDGSRVLVRQQTELRLTQSEQRALSGSRVIDIELLHGALENTVKPGDPAGRFEIRSPSAIAAVRGTEFRVNATNRQTWTEVLEGSVVVSNGAGQSAAGAGAGSFTEAGRAPGLPAQLLAAPDLSALPERLERLPIDWPLTPLPGAARYRTQIAPDKQFELVLSDETSILARVRAVDVADGNYVLRVRGIDASGLEGLSAERLLSVQARPEPPLLIEPAPDTTTLSERPNFRWTQTDAGWNYKLQIFPSGSDATTQPYEQTIIGSGNTIPQTDLPPGMYRWRVAAIDPARARQGPWGDSQSFRRVLPGPSVEPVQLAPGNLTLRWSAQPNTKTYRLQLSRDNSFGDLMLNTETVTPQYVLENLTAGKYHIRVRSVGDDGYLGPWGQPQSADFAAPEKENPEHWGKLLLLVPLLWLLSL